MTQYKYVEDLDRVLEAVAEQPGITLKELSDLLGRQYEGIRTATDRLRIGGKIKASRAPTSGPTLHFYPNHTKP